MYNILKLRTYTSSNNIYLWRLLHITARVKYYWKRSGIQKRYKMYKIYQTYKIYKMYKIYEIHKMYRYIKKIKYTKFLRKYKINRRYLSQNSFYNKVKKRQLAGNLTILCKKRWKIYFGSSSLLKTKQFFISTSLFSDNFDL